MKGVMAAAKSGISRSTVIERAMHLNLKGWEIVVVVEFPESSGELPSRCLVVVVVLNGSAIVVRRTQNTQSPRG